ncbi:hypothetical protein K32_02870 [Kaistia sp. 32K]|nr:hypothetical protein K32_02870 [Kaistia sp. 32K]
MRLLRSDLQDFAEAPAGAKRGQVLTHLGWIADRLEQVGPRLSAEDRPRPVKARTDSARRAAPTTAAKPARRAATAAAKPTAEARPAAAKPTAEARPTPATAPERAPSAQVDITPNPDQLQGGGKPPGSTEH